MPKAGKYNRLWQESADRLAVSSMTLFQKKGRLGIAWESETTGSRVMIRRCRKSLLRPARVHSTRTVFEYMSCGFSF